MTPKLQDLTDRDKIAGMVAAYAESYRRSLQAGREDGAATTLGIIKSQIRRIEELAGEVKQKPVTKTVLPRTLAEAADGQGITTEIDPESGKPLVWYYVETSWRKRDSDDHSDFMCHLVKADRPKDAERKAIDTTFDHHGPDIEVDFFMSRRLTEAKAQKILDSFNAGSWEGWRF